VAIDPGIFRGVLPLPASVLKGGGPFLVNPRTRGRAITLTFDQFKYGWANALDEKEAKELYDTFHVAGSGISLVQMGNANLNPWTEAKVNTTNPDRGPLLIIDGEKDHTVPWAIANAAYKRQRRNPGVTEIVKIPNRGHSLTIDHGWRDGRTDRARLRQAVRLAGQPHRPSASRRQHQLPVGRIGETLCRQPPDEHGIRSPCDAPELDLPFPSPMARARAGETR
jgi:pimeloyl-ACP methyl ester carboxylesterase